jgi:beta-lactam-binding protein with PASTA domain
MSYPLSYGYAQNTGATGLILRGFAIGAAPSAPLTLITGGLLGRPSSLIKRGFSSNIGLPEPPVTGEQYTDIASLAHPGYSLLEANPGAVLADVLVTSIATSGTHYAIVVNGDGTGYVAANGDTTRQSFQSTYFSVSGQAVESPAFTIDINDNPPQILNPLPSQFNYPLGATVDLDFVNGTPQYVYDPDGDPLTMTETGTLPPGLSISGTALVGNVTLAGTYSFSLFFQDPVGETLGVPVVFYVYATIIMPNLIGLTYAAGAAQLTSLGLILRGPASSVYSSTIPSGDIAGQSVAAGTSVAFATVVLFTSSLGPFNPNANFISLESQISTLTNAGLLVYPVFIYAYSSTIPDGYVISIAPISGTVIAVNIPVQITVSLGPPNPALSTTVPNVVGMQFLQAQETLLASQLELGAISWQYTAGEVNVVLSQSLVPTTIVPLFTQVNLLFNAGPSITYPGQGTITVPPLPTP